MKLTPIQHTVWLNSQHPATHTVDPRDYDLWRRGFVFEALRNRSYGESFAARFGIQDHLLRSFETVRDCHEYIARNYLRD